MSHLSKSSSLVRLNSNGNSLCIVLFFERLLVDETVEIDEGDEGIELECDDDGGESKRGKDDSKGSSLSSFSQSIKSSSSFRLMIFFSPSTPSSSASMISKGVAYRRNIFLSFCYHFTRVFDEKLYKNAVNHLFAMLSVFTSIVFS